MLAHERSFASWLRTGMAPAGIALGFHAICKSVEPTWVGKTIASAFLVIAILSFLSAQHRACRATGKLEPRLVVALRPVRIRLLCWSLVGATMLLGLAIWLFIED